MTPSTNEHDDGNELLLLAEAALADWLSTEEDDAWTYLQESDDV